MDIREKLIEAMEPKKELFHINLLGLDIPVSDTVVVMWIVMAFLIVSALILTRNMKQIPKGKQHLVEAVVEFFNNMCKNVIGHHWKSFAPYIGTVALFLVFSNTVSIFNILPSGEFLHHVTGIEFFKKFPEALIKPPTKDINVTVALAVMTMTLAFFGGLVIKKPRGFLKSFVEPTPLMLPFKVLDYAIKPTSLALRLFGNILGAFIAMELVYLSLPAILPAALSIYFDLFDGILQAYVFVFLSLFYIAEAVE